MLNHLVDAWNGGLTSFAILMLRILLIPILLYNLAWSFEGCINFIKRRSVPMSVYKSMIFFMSAGLLVRDFIFFTNYPYEAHDAVALTSVCLFMLGTVLATLTHHFSIAAKFNKLYWLFHHEHSDVAVHAAELARIDADYMRGVLVNAETHIALGIAKKVLSEK